MQYLAYFAVATPLLLAWLFWASATTAPPTASPLFHSFDEDLHQADVLKERALAQLAAAEAGAAVDDGHVQQRSLSARPMKPALAK